MSQAASQTKKTGLEQMSYLNISPDRPSIPRLSSIICTIGPVTNSVEMLTELRRAGMNVVRMNFSHGNYDYHQSVIDNARKSCELYPELGITAIALDTKGPEIRTGENVDGANIRLADGAKITLTTDKALYSTGSSNQLYVDYENIVKVLNVGDSIFIDDGLVRLTVESLGTNTVECKIANGGLLGQRKGVNLPNVAVDLPPLSEKDKNDLAFGVAQGVDMVFASFIRKAADVRAVREALGVDGKHVKIISKIENQEGVDNFDEILVETDGVMVARGDLGIEIPAEKVFLAQKMMIARCNIAGKPVITATQMLESMTENPRPTRAETSDVANSILDGSDCVMLSGETAKGKYPIEAVTMMSKICQEAEQAYPYRIRFEEMTRIMKRPTGTAETVACSAVLASYESEAKAIIVLTHTGKTADLVSKYHPQCPIISVTREARTARLNHLPRGVFPVFWKDASTDGSAWGMDVDSRIDGGIAHGKSLGVLKEGDTVVAVTGWRNGPGHSSVIRVLTIGETGTTLNH